MSITQRHRAVRSGLMVIAFVLAMTPVLVAVSGRAFADYPKLINRSLRVANVTPGAVTDYTFSWAFPSATTVRSIKLLFCADAYVEDTCSNTPPGDFSSAILDSQSGAVTGFSIFSQDTDEIIMTRASGAAGTGQSTYVFSDVQNPTGLPTPFFVQIFTYSTADATGTPIYRSSVANATTTPIMINTEVPQILFFCAGITVSEWCDNVNGNHIDYGDLSAVLENAAISQFGAATNAQGGYVITINGNTMAAGNRLIDSLTTQTASAPGTAQFGINLRANTTPPNGLDVTGSGIGLVTPNYDVPDSFQYNDGDMVAYATTGSMFNTYTVTYLVNIPPDQPSGIYNTTITYICTAAF